MVDGPHSTVEMPPTRRRYASKWLTLVLCEAVMMSSGTLYLFPIYSPSLKRSLDLTQEQVNFIGSCSHFGAFFSVFGGLFFDSFGARATLGLGGALKLIGLGLTYGILAGSLGNNTQNLAAFAAWLFGTGCSTSLTASLGANYATFRDKTVHGRLVGLLLSFFGLSSGVFSLTYDVFFTDPVSFVKYVAVCAGGVDLLSASVVGAPKHLALPPEETIPMGNTGTAHDCTTSFRAFFQPVSQESKLTRGQAACAMTATATALTAVLLAASDSSELTAIVCLLGITWLLGAQIYTLLVGSGKLTYKRNEMEAVDATGSEQSKRDLAKGFTQITPTQLFFSFDFYLLFVALLLGLGSGITVINNLAQMVSAFPELQSDKAGGFSHGLLKLLACANTLGRLASGSVSDTLSSSGKTTRAEFTVWLFIAMAGGMAVLAVLPDGAPSPFLVLGVSIIGASFGALFWAMPTLVMELFGSKHFGANRGIVGLSPAIGGWLLSTKLAGAVYAANAHDGVECIEKSACYRTSWICNFFVSVVAVGLCSVLARRDKRRRNNVSGKQMGNAGSSVSNTGAQYHTRQGSPFQ